MSRRGAILPLVLLSVIVADQAAAADAANGAAIAQRWCTSCHVIGEQTAGGVPQGPPSFRSIAAKDTDDGQLRVFLSHPHGAMPDLALTRVEIEDLIAYISSLR